MPSVFFLGATGYVGAEVLVQLKEYHPSWPITALVRDLVRADAIRSLVTDVVHGTVDDATLVEEHSANADIVIDAVDSNNLPLTEAVLRRMKRRWEERGKKGVYLHTSGGEVFNDGRTDGRADPSGKAWVDTNEDDIRSISTGQAHGDVDAAILAAAGEDYLDAYIVCPVGIIGKTRAPLPTTSAVARLLALCYLDLKRLVYIGPGTNVLPLVLVDDLADLYVRILDFALSGRDEGASPYTRYYIASVTDVIWADTAAAFGDAFKRHGLLQDGTPVSQTVAELGSEHLMVRLTAGSMRVRAERARALGWEPKPAALMAENIDGSVADFGRLADAGYQAEGVAIHGAFSHRS